MIFNAFNVLVNKELNKNEMVEGELYLFRVKGKLISAWLDNGVLKVKPVEKRVN